jgi:hypothetical protein
MGPDDEICLHLVHPLRPRRPAESVPPAVVVIPDVVGDVVCAVQQQYDVAPRVENGNGVETPEPSGEAAVGQRDVVPLDRDDVRPAGVANAPE